MSGSKTVQQYGFVTPGHAVQWTTDGVVQDGGSATNGTISNLGLQGTGITFAINDVSPSSAGGYHQLAFSANANGGGLLSYNAYGGATPQNLNFVVNGTTYDIAAFGVITAVNAGYFDVTDGTLELASPVTGNVVFDNTFDLTQSSLLVNTSTMDVATTLLGLTTGQEPVTVAAAGNVVLSGNTLTLAGTISGITSLSATTINATTLDVNAHSISFAGAFTTVGAYPLTLTATNTTSVTLPTSGTLATVAQVDAAVPAGIAGNVIFATGTAGVGSASTLSTANLPTSATIRTVPFPIVGMPSGGQVMAVTLTQAGTLLANGGTPQVYIGSNPTSTQYLTLKTNYSGTLTTQGTVTISTSGSVSWPSYAAVPFAGGGGTVILTNQATADATFANACLSFQYQVS